MTIPAAVPTNATVNLWYLTSIAAPSTGATVAEMTAGTTKELQCYITGDGLTPETSENAVDDPRLCSSQIFQRRGDYTEQLEIMYVFNLPSASDDVARLTLPAGTTGFVVVRWGIAYATAPAAGQKTDIYPIEAGVQRKAPPTRNGVHRITQRLFVTSTVVRDVAIAA